MNRETLRIMLRESADNGFSVPAGYSAMEIADCMLDFSGDTDPELRDDLCLTVFYKWSVKSILTDGEMRVLLEKAVDDGHLLLGLGQTDDTVFMRTFCALWVAVGICRHRESPYLAPATVRSVLDRLLVFYGRDGDVRGYVGEKGWAHGAAHGADALDELARCPETEAPDLRRILQALRDKVMIGHYGYIHQEDERMATAVTAVLERGLLEDTWLCEWVSGFEQMPVTGMQPHDVVLRVNTKQFLRSLAYRLQKPTHTDLAGAACVVTEAVRVLGRIDRFP